LTRLEHNAINTAMTRAFATMITLMSACFGQSNAVVTVKVSPSFARQGIAVSTIADSDFHQKLENLLGKDVVVELNPILPYMVVLANHSQLQITKTTVRYERTTPTGRIVYGWSQLDTTAKGFVALGPGATLVHAPRSNLSQLLLSAQSATRPGSGVIAAMSAQIASEIFDSRRFISTIVSLDSTIFKNGGVVGPDYFDVIGHSEAAIKAWSDIIGKISDDSITDGKLNGWLQQQAKQSPALAQRADGSLDHYVTAQIALARVALSRVSAQGRAALMKGGLPAQSEPQLFRLDQ